MTAKQPKHLDKELDYIVVKTNEEADYYQGHEPDYTKPPMKQKIEGGKNLLTIEQTAKMITNLLNKKDK